jgi:hypothetical protein
LRATCLIRQIPPSEDPSFALGSDFLMDGGVTASYWFGELAPK